ncbi:hypothetical protein MKX08_009966 [Trichoderma sp. CBMAI-0020]|nr:hypothetical protein MKX08_009966 [Trichoderma sp. CBMAI-0020]
MLAGGWMQSREIEDAGRGGERATTGWEAAFALIDTELCSFGPKARKPGEEPYLGVARRSKQQQRTSSGGGGRAGKRTWKAQNAVATVQKLLSPEAN